jgi:hypothetical protein
MSQMLQEERDEKNITALGFCGDVVVVPLYFGIV